MAEIHIEKKDRSPLPVIIAGLVLLALIAWWFFNGRGVAGVATDTADTGAVLMSTGDTDTELPTAVAVFLRWSDERITPSAMNPDHSHTATGIRNLAAALEGLAARAGVDIAAEANTIRAQADTLWANAASTRHADVTRKTFVSLSGLMGAVQQRLAPALEDEVAEVKRAAESISADEALLDQRDRVQAFFERSATVVRQLSET
ncbi:MAG TPA: hypothetical protein VJ802_18130 [Gemmatimonadaceae bacterium]|nr:hypothetical protein [Gemmatimonadaceae bacterium]